MQGAGLGRGFIFLLETCWSISITLNLCLRAKAASPRSPFPSGSPGVKAACTVRGLQTPRCVLDFSSPSSPGDQRPQKLHGAWGETCVRELAQAQEIQLSRRLQRACPSLPPGSFFWCAFAFQTALILPASPYLPAAVRHRSQEQPQGTNRPPPAPPTSTSVMQLLVRSCSSRCQQPPRPRRGAGLRSSSFGTSPAACSAPVLTVNLNKKSAKSFLGREVQE